MPDELALFMEKPWARSHSTYDASSFAIRPAPEFATSEVVIASLYRKAGFPGYREAEVPRAGRELDRSALRPPRRQDGSSRISPDTWRTILHGALQSPRQTNQSARRFLQLSPVVPDVALYSGSARLAGNPWDPGRLVATMVAFGAPDEQEAGTLWSDLHEALSVGPQDDIWARWLQEEFERRNTTGTHWQRTALPERCQWPLDERVGLRFPAQQFVQDLRAVLNAKSFMTRRQWITLLEAIVRLGAVSHVLWLCDVNDRIWRAARHVLSGGEAPSATTLVKIDGPLLGYAAPALSAIRSLASRYLTARLGINLLLHELDALGATVGSLASTSDIAAFLATIASQRDALQDRDVLARLDELLDREARTVACKKGVGSNIVEFCRYSLGQRQTADDTLRGYDQGYQLRKKGEYQKAPWIVSLGPVSLLSLVHCCLAEAAGPRSVQRLSEHLEGYGLAVDRDHFTSGELGKSLRTLGLVLDSPDAEGGMLLIPPFEKPIGNDESDHGARVS